MVMECLRGACCELFLLTQPASPETLENCSLFGEIGFLEEGGEGQRSARECHKGLEKADAQVEIAWQGSGSTFRTLNLFSSPNDILFIDGTKLPSH